MRKRAAVDRRLSAMAKSFVVLVRTLLLSVDILWPATLSSATSLATD